MKRYFIWAYESVFQAEKGIEDWLFFEGSFKDACDLGLDMSYDLILAHESKLKQIFENCHSREEAIENDMAYEVWELQKDAPTIPVLYKMKLSPKEYIEKFCKK